MKRLELISSQISQNTTTRNQKPAQYTKLSVYYQGAVGYISMRSPPELNCLGPVMMKELCEALLSMHYDEGVKVVVIVSQLNNIFCAGADIKWMHGAYGTFDYEYGLKTEPLHGLLEAFNKNRKPVIAGVNGKALGGGFELAMLCDVILASEKAYFGLPEINLGLMPGIGGTQKLAKLIGQKRAMRCILTGEGFPASEAWSMNIAQKVSSEKFNEEVQKFAQKIASKALTSLIIAKKAVKQSSNLTLNQGLDFEKDIFYSMFNTKAAQEGVSAFINKRKPNFQGL